MRGLWQYQGETVEIIGGSLEVELTTGEVRTVPAAEIEPVPGLYDLGKAESGQWVKIIVENGGKTLGVEVNALWPEDVPRFLRTALKIVEEGNPQ